jgi:CBS domain-containing protein
MRVSQVMTRNPVCCIPSDTAQVAALVMKRVDTGIVPVVNNEKDRKPVGLLTDRDLCMAVIAIDEAAASSQDPMEIPIERYMTTRVVSCGPEDDLDRAFALMKENRVRRLVVVDEHNAIQGVVSMADLILRSKIPEGKIRETLERICEPTGTPSKQRAAHAKTQA